MPVNIIALTRFVIKGRCRPGRISALSYADHEVCMVHCHYMYYHNILSLRTEDREDLDPQMRSRRASKIRTRAYPGKLYSLITVQAKL